MEIHWFLIVIIWICLWIPWNAVSECIQIRILNTNPSSRGATLHEVNTDMSRREDKVTQKRDKTSDAPISLTLSHANSQQAASSAYISLPSSPSLLLQSPGPKGFTLLPLLCTTKTFKIIRRAELARRFELESVLARRIMCSAACWEVSALPPQITPRTT